MSLLFARGIRGFTIASILMILVAIMHTTGLNTAPPNESFAQAMEAMEVATLEFGPLTMTFYGVYESVWIQVGLLLVAIAVTNMIVVVSAPETALARIVFRLSVFDAAVSALFGALFIYYQIPPPLISYAVLTVAFALAAFFSRNIRSEAGSA